MSEKKQMVKSILSVSDLAELFLSADSMETERVVGNTEYRRLSVSGNDVYLAFDTTISHEAGVILNM